MPARSFDLNIEEVLENWEVEHAIREIISNALDEQLISQTPEISISKDDQGDWHIRDYGRGLQIEHFTLNENKEKLDAPTGVIGKFGVGLKDALATFSRRGIEIVICSALGTYRLKQEHKHGFDDIVSSPLWPAMRRHCCTRLVTQLPEQWMRPVNLNLCSLAIWEKRQWRQSKVKFIPARHVLRKCVLTFDTFTSLCSPREDGTFAFTECE